MPAVDAVIVAAIVAAFVTFAGGARVGRVSNAGFAAYSGGRKARVRVGASWRGSREARPRRFLFVPVVCGLLIMQA